MDIIDYLAENNIFIVCSSLASLIGLLVAFWQLYKTKQEMKEIQISYSKLEGNTVSGNNNEYKGDVVAGDKIVHTHYHNYPLPRSSILLTQAT
ncbi:MAG: hypothetical protein ACJAQ0_001717, partial [Dasania sp.]